VALTDQLQELGLAVGLIVGVEEHVGARAPAYLLTVDVGRQGRHETSVPRGDYDPGELRDKQIVCALEGDELFVLAAHSHAGGLIFVGPDRDVEPGSIVV
jgi:tRNA-binding EMAP/Myf-like protein